MNTRGFTLIQMSVVLIIMGSVIAMTAKLASEYAKITLHSELQKNMDEDVTARLSQYVKMYKTLPGSEPDSKMAPARFDETLKPALDRNNIFYKTTLDGKVGEICSGTSWVTLYRCINSGAPGVKGCSGDEIVLTVPDLAYVIVHPGRDGRLSTVFSGNSVFTFSGRDYDADGLIMTDDDVVKYTTMSEAREVAECINPK